MKRSSQMPDESHGKKAYDNFNDVVMGGVMQSRTIEHGLGVRSKDEMYTYTPLARSQDVLVTATKTSTRIMHSILSL